MTIGRRVVDYFNIEPLLEYFQDNELISRVLSNYFENLLQLHEHARELNIDKPTLFPLLINSIYGGNLILTALDDEFTRHLLEETDYSEYPDLDALVNIYEEYITANRKMPVLVDVLALLPILPLSKYTLNNLSIDIDNVSATFLPVFYVEDLGYIPIINMAEEVDEAVSRYVPNLKVIKTIRLESLLNVVNKVHYVERLIDEVLDDVINMLKSGG